MTWGASTDTGGGNVTYHWSLSSGESGNTTSTSVNVYNKGAGNYSFTVYAYNPGGNSGTTSSNTVTVNNPPPPPLPTVNLVEGSSRYNEGACNGADCRQIQITGYHFSPNSTVTIQFYTDCDNNNPSYASGCVNNGGPYDTETTTSAADGSFTYDVKAFGYPQAKLWVVANGTQSNTVTWQ